MKKTRLFSFLGIITGLALLISCENLEDISNLGLRPHILTPALRTEIDVYDFERLLNQNTEYRILFADIQDEAPITITPGLTIPIFPEVAYPGKLDSEYMNIFDIAHRIFLDEAKATLSFTNTFPVPIKKDTRFILRDSANHNNVFFTHTLQSDVAAGAFYAFNFSSEKDTISSTLEFFVENLTLGSGTNVSFSGEDFVITLTVGIVDIDKVELKNNVSYSDTATHDFEINIPNPEDTAAYSGFLSIFLTNKYPAGFDLKLDLMDENNNLVYSIFGDSSLFLPNAPVDGNGKVSAETSASKINFINVEQINNLNTVKKMKVGVTLITPDQPDLLILDEVTSVDMLITADIKVDPSKAK